MSTKSRSLLKIFVVIFLLNFTPFTHASGNEYTDSTCTDPLIAIDEIDTGVLQSLSNRCPTCPLIEQARYANRGDYISCVVVNAVEMAISGTLEFQSLITLVQAARSATIGRSQPARTLLPGPGENGYSPALARLARQYDRQFFSLNAAPFSMSLDAYISDPDARTAVTQFLSDPSAGSGADAFQNYTGLSVFDVVDSYNEIGDLGMFGGVAAAADAFRYAVLNKYCVRAEKYCKAAMLARQRLMQILDAVHIAHAITGSQGVIARGLARRGMKLPPGSPPPVPVLDASGNPNPDCLLKPENPTLVPVPQRLLYREDATQTVPGDPSTGQFPEWIWMDNASKDQLIGWVFAMGVLYDVIRRDKHIPKALVARLKNDAATMARRLMRVGGPLNVDLTIIDGDGCATSFHDLHAKEFQGVPISFFLELMIAAGGDQLRPEHKAILSNFRNGFNALMALATMRTLCHISHATDVCNYYYDELVDKRHWPQMLLQDSIPLAQLPQSVRDLIETLGLFPSNLTALGSIGVDLADKTNYSNVNMAFIAFWGLLRYEPEPDLRQLYLHALNTSLWDTGISPKQPALLHQSLFDFIYTAFYKQSHNDINNIIAGAFNTLTQFPQPPYYDPSVENCDEQEIITGVCTAIDGNQIQLAAMPGDNDAVVAVDPLPKKIRPPSNFEWRSSPYDVNGGGSNRLNPGGDFRAAYWMGRFLRRNSANLARSTIGRDEY